MASDFRSEPSVGSISYFTTSGETTNKNLSFQFPNPEETWMDLKLVGPDDESPAYFRLSIRDYLVFKAWSLNDNSPAIYRWVTKRRQ